MKYQVNLDSGCVLQPFESETVSINTLYLKTAKYIQSTLYCEWMKNAQTKFSPNEVLNDRLFIVTEKKKIENHSKY